ncbi:MAG: hypothetical protein JWO20_2955, partial [Candidatus Angelobacter sp.]|nr:hypothetical protein [Candidatus Angelobacter sp.]
MTDQAKFAAKVAELIKQSRALTPAARKTVMELLDEARTRIAGQVATLNPQGFQAAQLKQLRFSIDQAMGKFATDASHQVNLLQAQAARIGTQLVSEPLGELALGHIATDRLVIAQGYAADLITNLSKKSAADLNGVIQRAFLGGQQMSDILSQVSSIVGGDRAPVVATTEILRVQSIATQATLEEATQRHPDLKKQWQHVAAARVPRVSHIIADGLIRAVDEAFDVDGELLMFPRDPNGSAYNSVY